jgi:hypothetical protein
MSVLRREDTVPVPVIRVPIGMPMGIPLGIQDVHWKLGDRASFIPVDMYQHDVYPERCKFYIQRMRLSIQQLSNNAKETYGFQEDTTEHAIEDLYQTYSQFKLEYQATKKPPPNIVPVTRPKVRRWQLKGGTPASGWVFVKKGSKTIEGNLYEDASSTTNVFQKGSKIDDKWTLVDGPVYEMIEKKE